ncbi:MAG TPA: beta-eliminating lyase-related protein [Steroidobacter sp.]|uniref:threonine aldolase family protein n=1 Tax=Steroidobacter sp. TaxID=1978227 RepID=UPI002EDA32BD
MNFCSDNAAPVCPEIMEAMLAANTGSALAYGEDAWTQRLDAVFSAYFDAPVRAFAVVTGTAANALALASVTPSYGAVFTHEQAHVLRDECGAPELFTGGAQLRGLSGTDGKLTAVVLEAALKANPPSVHSTKPAAISISQATEAGTCYRPHEVAQLSAFAHQNGMHMHVDGARLANAIAFLDCHPAEITWRAGVDVLSFGATKNGALAAEAVVFFDQGLAEDFELRCKRAGHLISKSRYVSSQLLAYMESGVWLRSARRANALAISIAAHAQPWLMYPVEANQIFLALGTERRQRLHDLGFEFYDWGAADSGEARFVVSWNQSQSDIDALAVALDDLCGN